MDTTTAQPTQPTQVTQDSYADAYVPPPQVSTPVAPVSWSADPVQSQPVAPQPVQYTQPMEPAQPVLPVQSEPVATPEPVQPMQSYQPAEPQPAEPQPAAAPVEQGQSETLADQNIFEMLGVTTGTPEQREQFLDELQQVIWDDFLEHDVKLLLTEQEQADLDQILGSSTESTLEQQEKIVVFLEKLIPDLEDIMLEKALQLKAEMARERLSALKELHRNEPDKMAIIATAEQQMSQDLWRSATVSLSTVG